MKYINKLLLMIFLSIAPISIHAITIVNESLWNIELRDDKGFEYGTYIVSTNLKNRIEILVKKIEDSKNLHEKYAEFVSLSLSTQLSVELEVLKLILLESVEDRENSITMFWELIYKSSDAEEIKNCLQSIEIEKEIIRVINNCLDWSEKLKQKYCSYDPFTAKP